MELGRMKWWLTEKNKGKAAKCWRRRKASRRTWTHSRKEQLLYRDQILLQSKWMHAVAEKIEKTVFKREQPRKRTTEIVLHSHLRADENIHGVLASGRVEWGSVFWPVDSVTGVSVSRRCESGPGKLPHVDELKDCCDGAQSQWFYWDFVFHKMLLDQHSV